MGRFAIFGAGGFGREVAPLAIQAMGVTGDARQVLFVSDFNEPITNGMDLIRPDQLTAVDEVVIAVADPAARRNIAARVEAQGASFGSVRALDFAQYEDVEIGDGAIFCAGSMATSNIRIGVHFHCNLGAYVAHDCRIGDFVTFAPKVCCNGNVTIEDDVYVGTGALLMPGITIGKGAVIGMGAVVLRDVAAGATVVGNPARPI